MFKLEEGKNYSMPVFFGADDYDPNAMALTESLTALTMTQEVADGKFLEQYLPEGFTLLRPEMNITLSQFTSCNWLSGGNYRGLEVNVPARFDGEVDHVEGKFVLVIWESDPYPMMGGREDSGMPKICANVEEIHTCEGTWYTSGSMYGNTFITLEMFEPQAVSESELEQIKDSAKDVNAFGYRYFRKVGAAGYDLCQPTLFPQSLEVQEAWRGIGKVKWTPLGRDKYYHGNGYRILEALSSIPIKSTTASMVRGPLAMKSNIARVLK